jgi:hypothetical protein
MDKNLAHNVAKAAFENGMSIEEFVKFCRDAKRSDEMVAEAVAAFIAL